MKKIIHLAILFVILMGITACAPKTAPTTNTPSSGALPATSDKPVADLAALCANEKGKWSAEYQECEGASQTWCQTNGGKFNECASACRHDPKAEVCTMQCVLVCEFSKADVNKPIIPKANVPPVVGGDKDEHGCIGSAGYQWCEAKKRCLRMWEDPCYPGITLAIQQAFLKKYKKSPSEVSVAVTKATDTHAAGGVKYKDGEGGNFLAKFTDGKWEIVFDGNGGIACKDLEKYQFPKEMTQDLCTE